MLLSLFCFGFILTAWLFDPSAVGLLEAVDWLGRWLLVSKAVSLLMPPLEVFEKRFGRGSNVAKTYEFIGDIVKYFGNLDLRNKMIELYPAYRELKPKKEMEKTQAFLRRPPDVT